MIPSLGMNFGFLQSLVIAQLTVLGSMALFARHLPPQANFLVVTCACLTGIIIFYLAYARKALGRSCLGIVLCAFLLRVLVGAVHYLLLQDPNYFAHPSQYALAWDWEWMHQSMLFVANEFRNYGFLAKLPKWYWLENKNAYLLAYDALLYYFSGDYVLNIAPWNSLHIIYTGYIVGAIALQCGCSRKQALVALTLAVFQPFGFISTLMERDFVGQAWIALAVYLVLVAQARTWLLLCVLPISGFLAYCQRQPYLAVILVGAACLYVINKHKNPTAVIAAIGVAIVLFFRYNLRSVMYQEAFSRYSGSAHFGKHLVTSYIPHRSIMLPLLFIRAIMGPFPWFQIFDKNIVDYLYMPEAFLQSVFNVALMLTVFPLAWQEWKRDKKIDPAFLFGLLFFLTALLSFGVHSGYVTIGMIFFMPLASRAGLGKFKKYLMGSAIFFLGANIGYWLLGLKGSAILQGITGY
ncbi:MAG: hypothetical protein WBQ36_06950 [Desulfobaccales bacterium]